MGHYFDYQIILPSEHKKSIKQGLIFMLFVTGTTDTPTTWQLKQLKKNRFWKQLFTQFLSTCQIFQIILSKNFFVKLIEETQLVNPTKIWTSTVV